MVTTRAGAKRDAAEAALDAPIQLIKSQLIGLGVVSAKKCPGDRMLRILYEKHVTFPSKRPKGDPNHADVPNTKPSAPCMPLHSLH